MWKVLRRNFKMGRSASMPAIKVSVAVPQHQVPPLDVIRLAPNPIPQNQVYRPSTIPALSSACPIPLIQVPTSTLIRACPSTTLVNSTVRNPVRSHQQRSLPLKNGVQPASVQPSSASQQLLSNAQRSSRAHNIVNGSLHCTSSPPIFKRFEPVRGSQAKNRSAYGSTYNSNYVNPLQTGSLNNSSYANPSQYGRIPSPMAALNNGIRFSWQEVHNSLNPMPMGSGIVGSALAPPPPPYSPPPPPPPYSPPPPPPPYSPPPPPPPPPYSPPLHQSAYGENVQQGSQIQNDGQNFYQYGNQSQNASQNVSLQGIGPTAVDLGFSDCNYSWMNNTSQSIQQPQPPIESSQVQTTEAIYGPVPVKEPDHQSGSYPNLKSLESDFDSWLLDNQPVPSVTNDSVPGVDAGMLYFDFETSFNSLTQV